MDKAESESRDTTGRERDQLTVAQAGRRGGQSTLEHRGIEFYRRIGKKGGQRTAELYRELLSEFGRKGGRPRRPNLENSVGEGPPQMKEAENAVGPGDSSPT